MKNKAFGNIFRISNKQTNKTKQDKTKQNKAKVFTSLQDIATRILEAILQT